jgi:DNA-binding IclR family transcriptional regulator
MTIHFHTNHFVISGLPLLEYFILLLHESKERITISVMMKNTGVTERTVVRARQNLHSKGYLSKNDRNEYVLTDKAYK